MENKKELFFFIAGMIVGVCIVFIVAWEKILL